MVNKELEGIICGVHTLDGVAMYELRKVLKKKFALNITLMSKKALPKSFIFFSNSLLISVDSSKKEGFTFLELKKLESFLANYDIYYICFVNKSEFISINSIYKVYEQFPRLEINLFSLLMLVKMYKFFLLMPFKGVKLVLKALIRD